MSEILPSESNQKAWLLTASLENWGIAQEKALFGCHGNRSFLKKIKRGDYFVAYAPQIGFIGSGRITGGYFVSDLQIWNDKVYSHRFQISTPFISGKALPAAAIVDDLDFISDKKRWGVFLKSGIREIPTADWQLISDKLKKTTSLIPDVVPTVIKKESSIEIGNELHNRVAKLFENLGFNIIDNNYFTAGPDITVVDSQDRGGGKIIIQCKNSREEKKTFRHLDKHLHEYSGRLSTSGAKVAILAIGKNSLPKKVPGEDEELDTEKILQKYNVAIWTSETIKYYEELINKISHFARYQVLSDLGLKAEFDSVIETEAVKVEQNGYVMYATSLKPDWLLKTASVIRRIRGADKPKGYQRLLDRGRIDPKKPNSIAYYITTNTDWFFPNALVLASSPESFLEFQDNKLKLKSHYGQFWVIDGQHRLFAFANSKLEERKKKLLCIIIDSKSLGEVRAKVDNPMESERAEESKLAQVFVNLNGKGKKVPKALLYELNDLLGSKDNPSLEIVTKLINTTFFKGHIRGYSDKGGSINLVAFADAKGTKLIYGYFLGKNTLKTREEIITIAKDYILDSFKEISKIFNIQWNDPDTYFLKTDRGVKGMLNLIAHVLKKNGPSIENIRTTLAALKESEFDFDSATARGRFLGAGGPDQLMTSFSRHINKIIPTFAPEASSSHTLTSQLSPKGDIPVLFLKEWLGRLEGEVRCYMMFIDESTVKYLEYLNPQKIEKIRMFFGNCDGNKKKIRENIIKLRDKGFDIVLTQSRKKTSHKGSFFHARWIGDASRQVQTEVDLKDNSLKGAAFRVNVLAWTNPPEVEDFDRYWDAAELNSDVQFEYDWLNQDE